MARDAERQSLDHEIEELEARVIMLKRQRNGLLPIGSMPLEILSCIFSGFLGKWTTYYDYPTLVAITHVCSWWRSTALGNAALWGKLDVAMGRANIERFLSRSKDRPISLTAYVDHGAKPTAKERRSIETVLQNHRRLASVDLQLPALQLDGVLTCLAEEMSNMTKFVFHNHSDNECTLPTPLFGNHAPRLKLLSLQNIQIPWAARIFSGLTSLSLIICDGYNHAERPSPAVFFNLLRQVPALQHLTVGGVFPSPESLNPMTINNDVLLNSLQTLNAEENCRVFYTTWRHIQAPASVQVTLSLSDVLEPQLRELLEAVHFFPTAGSTPSRAATCVRIKMSGDRRISLYDGLGAVVLNLKIQNTWWTPEFLSLVLDCIPLANMRCLDIDGIREDVLAATLDRLQWIRELHMHGSLEPRILDVVDRYVLCSSCLS